MIFQYDENYTFKMSSNFEANGCGLPLGAANYISLL